MREFIDGKKIRDDILEKEREFFLSFEKENGRKARLAVFIVGDDEATNSFVRAKKNMAEKLGVDFLEKRYSDAVDEEDLIEEIKRENKKSDGIIVQLPLPEDLNQGRILNSIDKKKDVDLLSDEAWEEFVEGEAAEAKPLPPVAGAIWEILKSKKLAEAEKWKNKKVLMVGHGKLVGEPISILFKKKNINFNIIDKNTSQEKRKILIKEADLIISGVGVPNLIQKEMIKDNIFLIDAGTSSDKAKIVGDISLDCIEKASYFSKTPGGVGPVTTAIIFSNLRKKI